MMVIKWTRQIISEDYLKKTFPPLVAMKHLLVATENWNF
jgi:hypothetical protein